MIEMKGNIQVQSYRAELQSAFDDVSGESLDTFGEIVARRAKQIVPSPSSPPLPMIGKRKPRPRTGALRASIEHKVRKVYRGEGREVRIYTGPGRNGFRYGLPVEQGLPGRSYRNTPFMMPAFRESVPALPNIMQLTAERKARQQVVKDIMRKAARRERQYAKRMKDVDLDEID